MKMVAAAKMKKSQERMEQARPYSKNLSEMIAHLLSDVALSSFPLLSQRSVKRKAYVVVAADRGLAGAFNTNLLKKAESEINKFGKEKTDIFCIGKKSRDYFTKRDYNVVGSFTDFWSEMEFDTAMMIGRSVISHFLNEKVDEVVVVYNYFLNVVQQEVISEKLLPLSFDKSQKVTVDRLYEPSKEQLIETLIPRHLNVQMWKFLLESYASEQAARMLSMENATTNAQDMIKNLTLEFNKARQAAITTEMLEIVGGAEALG